MNTHTNTYPLDDIAAHARVRVIGRPQELRRLRNLLTRISRDTVAVAHVTGPVGVGKTHLVLALAAQARSENMRVVLTSAPLTSGDGTFGIVDQIAEQLHIDATATSESLGRNVRVALHAQSGMPLLVVIDAVDRLSTSDLEFVESILRQPPVRRMVVVVTSRSDTNERSPGAREFLRGLTTDTETLTLRHLSEADVVGILESWFPDEALSPEFTTAAFELTEGNAYYLSCIRNHILQLTPSTRWEILQGRASLAEQEPLAAAESLLPLMTGDLDRRRQLTLRALALRDTPASMDDIVQMTELPIASVYRSLERLEEAGLITGIDRQGEAVFRVANPVLRAAIARHTPLLTRHTLHARAAEALATQFTSSVAPPGADGLAAFATHARAGAVLLDAFSARLLLTYAERLLEHGRNLSARHLLEYVLGALDQQQHAPAVRAHIVALLSRACARLGDSETADQLLEGLGITPAEPVPYPMIAARRLRRLVDAGNDHAAFSLFETHIRTDTGIEPRRRAQQLADAGLAAFNTGRLEDAEQLGNDAVALAHALHDLELESVLIINLVTMALRCGEPALALELGRTAYAVGRRSGSHKAMARTAAGIGAALGDLGALTRALRWFARAQRHARIAGDRAATSAILKMQARRQFEYGDWTKALESVRSGLAVDEQAHRSRSGQLQESFARLIEASIGHAASTTSGEPTLAIGPGESPPEVVIADVIAIAAAQVSGGRIQESRNLLLALSEACTGHRNATRALLTEVLPAIAEAAALLGDAPALKEVQDVLQQAVDEGSTLFVVPLEAEYARALVIITADVPAPGVALARSVAERLEEHGFRWRAARVWLAAGAAEVRAHDEEQATGTLRHAYELYEQMGAVHGMARARTLLAEIGRKPGTAHRGRSADHLTSREMEIARLATENLSNAEIAARLVISERTVSTHMQHILRKLHIRSRVQIQPSMLDQDAVD